MISPIPDAARSYGRAEEFLAGWLTAHPEIDDVEIGSKWGYRYVGDWRTDAEVHEVKDHSLAAFTAQWAQTSALLGDRVGVRTRWRSPPRWRSRGRGGCCPARWTRHRWRATPAPRRPWCRRTSSTS